MGNWEINPTLHLPPSAPKSNPSTPSHTTNTLLNTTTEVQTKGVKANYKPHWRWRSVLPEELQPPQRPMPVWAESSLPTLSKETLFSHMSLSAPHSSASAAHGTRSQRSRLEPSLPTESCPIWTVQTLWNRKPSPPSMSAAPSSAMPLSCRPSTCSRHLVFIHSKSLPG